MNTKTDGISSGLVAVAWQHGQRGLGETEWQDWQTVSWKPQGPESDQFRMRPLCVLSDAEQIISDLQNLVVAKNQRKQQLEEQVEKQAAALKLARIATKAVVTYQELLESGNPHGLINTYAEAYESCVEALAAIDALGEVK